mgnify:CR=1 FL=1
MYQLETLAKDHGFNLKVSSEMLRREGYTGLDSYASDKAFTAYKKREILVQNKVLEKMK